jgi:hypothetical protein
MKNIVSSLLAALLAGCGGKAFTGIDSAYPPSLPPLMQLTQGVCPDISGTWSNASEGGSHSWQDSLLYRLTGSMAEPTVIVIRTTSNTVSVEFALNPDASAMEHKQLRRGEDFECKDSALWPTPKRELSASARPDDVPAAVYSRFKFGFRRDADGNLVGEERVFTAAVAFFIIPAVVGWQTFWFRWQAAK